MKIAVFATLAATLMIAVGSIAAAEPEDIAGVEKAALVVVAAELRGGMTAEALCFSAKNEASASFCYYSFGDSVVWRDDDAGFDSKKLRVWDADNVHERWASGQGIEIDFEKAYAELPAALASARENGESLREHAEVLGAIVLDFQALTQSPRPPDKPGFAVFAHQQAQSGILLYGAVGSTRNSTEAAERIKDLESTSTVLREDLDRKRRELEAARKEIDALEKRAMGLYSTPLGMHSALELFLGAALACVLLGMGIGGLDAWSKTRRGPVVAINPSVTVSPEGGGRGIGECVSAIREHARQASGRKIKIAINKNCDAITKQHQILMRTRDEETLSVRESTGLLLDNLRAEGVHGGDLASAVGQVVNLFSKLRDELGGIIGDRNATGSARNQVQQIERHLRLSWPTDSGDRNGQRWTFADLTAAWRELDSRYRELRKQLIVVSDVPLGDPQQDFERLPAVFERLKSAMAIRKCFREFRPDENESTVAGDLIRLASVISHRCQLSSESSAAVLEQIQGIFDCLDALAEEHLDQELATSPIDILDLAGEKLQSLEGQRKKLRNDAVAIEKAIARLAQQFLPGDLTRVAPLAILKSTESEFGDLRRQISESEKTLRRLGARDRELTDVEDFLKSHFGGGLTALDNLQLLTEDRDAGLDTLREYLGSDTGSVKETAENVAACFERAKATVRQVLPEATGRVDEVAALIVASHEQIEVASQTTRELCRLFSQYLEFDWREFTRGEDVRGYIAVLEREFASEHRPLRLGLCAALVAWRRVREVLESRPDGSDLVQGLRLPSVQLGLEQLMQRLEHLPADELWVKGLRPGFSRDWMHDLFRAELVLESFYVRDRGQQDLEDGISLATATVRFVMQGLGKGIEGARLLEPFPSQRPAGWAAPRYLSDRELRTLPEVNRRVRKLLETHDNFIVDIESFRLVGDNEHSGECRVVVVNPAEWRQAQEA